MIKNKAKKISISILINTIGNWKLNNWKLKSSLSRTSRCSFYSHNITLSHGEGRGEASRAYPVTHLEIGN